MLLAKSAVLPLGLSARMPVVDEVYQKKICRSGTTALIISNEEMEDIMRVTKSLEESGLLVKEISETFKNETKEQKWGFFSMLLGRVAVSCLTSALTGK